MGYTISSAFFFTKIMRDSGRLHAIFVTSLALLVCKAHECKPTQIVWKKDTRYKCLECPECPAGSQPSVPCGSSVKYGTPVHCVPCDPGRTYSNSYGDSQCQSCTVCSEGRAIKKNCTLFANTVCDDKCIVGYYHVPLVSECLRCAECCGDEHDENATDCLSGEKKCKIRSTGKPCKRKESRTDATTTNDNKLSSTTSQPAKQEPTTTIRPTTQEHGRTVATTGKKPPTTVMVHDDITSQTTAEKLEEAIRSTAQGDGSSPRSPSFDDEITMGRREKDNETLLYVVYSLIATMIVMLAVFAILFVTRQRREPRDRAACNKAETGESTSSQATKTNSGLLTVELFEQRHLEEFDKMCMKLDKRIGFFRRNYVSLAAKYQEISLDERDSLHGERQKKEGSPSRELMSLIKAKYPNHSVLDFIKNLKEIGRNDIVEILEPLVKNTA